jgi:hypothetical protein
MRREKRQSSQWDEARPAVRDWGEVERSAHSKSAWFFSRGNLAGTYNVAWVKPQRTSRGIGTSRFRSNSGLGAS